MLRKIILITLLLFAGSLQAAVVIQGVRVWPAADYTRITLESNKPINSKVTMLKGPDRLVLDMDDVELGPVLKSLPDKISSSDPYIRQVRVANFKPSVVRMVIDLKSEINPKSFNIPPAGEYQHRLVLDIYPLKDSLLALLEQHEKAASAVKPPKPDMVLAQPASVQPATVVAKESSIKLEPATAIATPRDAEVHPSPAPAPAKDTSTSATDASGGVAIAAPQVVEAKPLDTNNVVDSKNNDVKAVGGGKKPSSEVSATASTTKPANEKDNTPKDAVVKDAGAKDAAVKDTAAMSDITKPDPIKPEGISNKSDVASTPSEKEKATTKVEKQFIKTGQRYITIAIDAGHGGEDPGAQGANGTHEKDVTLAIAKKLKELIDNEPNMRGILTRDDDFFIPLHGRVVKARNMQADLFVSVHADAFVRQDAKGSSVFALSEKGATSASARYLAKKENESDLIGGVSLDDKDPNLARTLLDLSQTATITDSLKLAKVVLQSVGEVNTLHRGKVEQAGFAVLKSPDIPSILVETAFISNPDEERRLNDEDYQHKLAKAILVGIKKYFAGNPALAKTKMANQP